MELALLDRANEMVVAALMVAEDKVILEKVRVSRQAEGKEPARMELEQILSERRGKSLPISLDDVIQCIITHDQQITKINRVLLPGGFYCKGVYYDPMSESFRFAIFSEEFDPVPKGMEFPLIKDIDIVELVVAHIGIIEQEKTAVKEEAKT